MEEIKKYFPDLTELQISQFEQLGDLYREWNEKINVISRKDIDNLYIHHILHSMAIAKVIKFKPNAHVLDLGTGGGLPGIPLAILFPKTQFVMIDGRNKKIIVTNEIINALNLPNAKAEKIRAEEIKQKFDFVVCRGVAKLDKLRIWIARLIKRKEQHAIPNGLLALKGGNIEDEIAELPKGEYVEEYPLKDYFSEAFYEEKYLLYLQA